MQNADFCYIGEIQCSGTNGRVVSNFIVQALRGEDITVYGQGEQTRSFCYVDDMVDALMRLMNAPTEFIGPVNLGNRTNCPSSTLARRIIAMTPRPALRFKPLPENDPRRGVGCSLAKKRLGWEPSTDLESGLSRTIDYFAQLLRQRH